MKTPAVYEPPGDDDMMSPAQIAKDAASVLSIAYRGVVSGQREELLQMFLDELEPIVHDELLCSCDLRTTKTA